MIRVWINFFTAIGMVLISIGIHRADNTPFLWLASILICVTAILYVLNTLHYLVEGYWYSSHSHGGTVQTSLRK